MLSLGYLPEHPCWIKGKRSFDVEGTRCVGIYAGILVAEVLITHVKPVGYSWL